MNVDFHFLRVIKLMLRLRPLKTYFWSKKILKLQV